MFNFCIFGAVYECMIEKSFLKSILPSLYFRMRGVLSEAMVMCASTPNKIEILDPPPGSVPGDRIVFEGYPGN